MPARLEPSGLSHSPTSHPQPQLVKTKLAGKQKPFLNAPLTNSIAALAHRSMVKAFMVISTCMWCSDATRQRARVRMGSKEGTYLGRLLNNDGLDHTDGANAVSLVAREQQGAQEASRCAP